MSAKQTVKVECGSCGGTGLYCGFAEKKGTAVVCLSCGGSGCVEISFTPFVKRKGKRGIHIVIRAAAQDKPGSAGDGYGRSISYERFRDGEMP